MIVGVPRETFPGERRVAMVPLVIPTLAKSGLEVHVEAGAGVDAGYPDAEYAAKGAKIVADRRELFAQADILVQVLCYGSNDKTGQADVPLFHEGQVLIGFLRPLGALGPLQEIAAKGVISFSIELMPRSTRAQSMDALSSMGTICGYKAVLHRRRHVAENLPHADHRRRHDHSRPRLGDRRGRCRAPGHRHGAPPRRGHFRV